MKYIVDIKGEIEGDYEIIGKYEGRPQVNVIPQECMKVLAEAVVDVVQQIDWKALCEKVAERPKGEWLHNSDRPDNLICSVCNCGWDMWRYESKELKYCPNCGADMRKGDET